MSYNYDKFIGKIYIGDRGERFTIIRKNENSNTFYVRGVDNKKIFGREFTGDAIKAIREYEKNTMKLTTSIVTIEQRFIVSNGRDDRFESEQTTYIKITHRYRQEYDSKLNKAIEDFQRQLANSYGSDSYIDYFYDPIVNKITEAQLSKFVKNKGDVKMYSAVPKGYSFIPADINQPKVEGMCVVEFLLSQYKTKIPSLTEERIYEIVGPASDNTDDKGLCTEQILNFCNYYKISLYALDFTHHVFKKKIAKNSNYPALMYYCINEHLYPITDKKTRQLIVQSSIDSVKHITHLQDNYEAKETDTIERFKLPMYEDIEITNLSNYSNCNIFYHTLNLYQMLLSLFENDNKQYKCKWSGGKVTCIKYNNNVNLYANPNHRCKLDWNDSIKVCAKFNIPFKNQSLQALAFEIFESTHFKGNRQYLRKYISKSIKDELFANQNGKCNNCKSPINEYYECDHIKRLASGGDNSKENLQLLCKKCHEEKSNRESCEHLFNIDGIMSSYNTHTKNVFSAPKNGFVHTYGNKFNSEMCAGLDLNKCRRNILLHNKSPFCIFSVLDDIAPAKNLTEIKTGFYFVVTNNLLPFKGNGWYSHVMVKYGIESGLIKFENIKYTLYPSITLQPDYFNKYINIVVNDNDQYSKFMVNGLIGQLGHKMRKIRKCYLTTSANEASYMYFTNGCFIKQNKNNYYECLYSNDQYLDDSYIPIFNQILDLEAIELHKIYKLIKKHNGRIVSANTDNAIGEFKSINNINAFYNEANTIYFDDQQTCKKYKQESQVKIKNRYETLNKEMFVYEGNFVREISDPENNDFAAFANELIESNTSMEIQGIAGAGKSFLLKQIMKQLDEKNIKYICAAPTNKACRVLHDNAITIHKFISLYKDNIKALNNYAYIIIDEKSMIQELFFRILFNIKQNTTCKIILTGDWRQLPPVCDRSNFDYENSSIVKYICNSTKVVLTKCRRSDVELFNACVNVDSIDPSKYPQKICKKSIAFTNKKRKDVNQQFMKKYSKNKQTVKIAGNKYDQNSQDMVLFNDMPVVVCQTSNEFNIANGEEYFIHPDTFDKNNVSKAITIYETKFRCPKQHRTTYENKIIIPYNKFNTVFYPAYCITVHKSQGASFDFPYTIFEWNKFNTQMKYVAMTRATKLEYVNIVV